MRCLAITMRSLILERELALPMRCQVCCLSQPTASSCDRMYTSARKNIRDHQPCCVVARMPVEQSTACANEQLGVSWGRAMTKARPRGTCGEGTGSIPPLAISYVREPACHGNVVTGRSHARRSRTVSHTFIATVQHVMEGFASGGDGNPGAGSMISYS